ncbi:MAG: hypothetical protein AAFR28_00315 [Pseudomonadota bacterium]
MLNRLLMMAVFVGVVMPAAATETTSGGENRFDGFEQPSYLGLPQPAGFEFRPERIVVVTGGGALAAKVPHSVLQYETNRPDLTETPLFGELFDPRPGTRLVSDANLWGEAYRDGDALIINIPRAPFVVEGESQFSVLRRNRGGGVRELLFKPRWNPEAYAGATGMTKLGDVYVEGSRIVVRPLRLEVHQNLKDGPLF